MPPTGTALPVTGDLDPGPGRFVLGLDGTPVAATHGHGHGIDWL